MDEYTSLNYPGIFMLGAICITGYYIIRTVRAKQWPHVAANFIILGGLWLGAKSLLDTQWDDQLWKLQNQY